MDVGVKLFLYYLIFDPSFQNLSRQLFYLQEKIL